MINLFNVLSARIRNGFYLISLKANRGTVSPTSYNIIHDDTGLSLDRHQQLAYALTHLYSNWTVSRFSEAVLSLKISCNIVSDRNFFSFQGNIRVPAPIQYAHKLAYLVGESNFSNDPQPNLANFPYYL